MPTGEGFITEELIELVADMLAKRWHKSRIKKAIREIDANVHHVTIERLITAARESLLLKLRESKDDQRMKTIQFYESIISDENASTRDRMAAQQALNDVVGIGGQFKTYEQSPSEIADRARQHFLRLQGSMEPAPEVDETENAPGAEAPTADEDAA